MWGQMVNKSEGVRLAILEKQAEDCEERQVYQERVNSKLADSIDGLTKEIHKGTLRLEKFISTVTAFAVAFGSLGGIIGSVFTLFVQYVMEKK